MSKCEDCKHCDQELLDSKKWYCINPDVVASAVSKFDLPFNDEHWEYCFERGK